MIRLRGEEGEEEEEEEEEEGPSDFVTESTSIVYKLKDNYIQLSGISYCD